MRERKLRRGTLTFQWAQRRLILAVGCVAAAITGLAQLAPRAGGQTEQVQPTAAATQPAISGASAATAGSGAGGSTVAGAATTSPAADATTRRAAPVFSEDFESGQLDPKIWTQEVTGQNIVKVQSDKVAHGKYALLVRCPVPSNKTWAFISMSKLPAALRQHHFGRCYMFITPQPPSRHTVLIMGGSPGFPNNHFQEIATANQRWQLTYVDLRPNGDKEDYHAGGDIPVNRWICLEWEFNNNPNHTTIWVDGKQVYETGFVNKATGATKNLLDGFTDYAFGIRLWGDALAPFDVYYDDIALDADRIGPIPDAK